MADALAAAGAGAASHGATRALGMALGFLDAPQLARCRQLSRALRAAAEQDDLWRAHCAAEGLATAQRIPAREVYSRFTDLRRRYSIMRRSQDGATRKLAARVFGFGTSLHGPRVKLFGGPNVVQLLGGLAISGVQTSLFLSKMTGDMIDAAVECLHANPNICSLSLQDTAIDAQVARRLAEVLTGDSTIKILAFYRNRWAAGAALVLAATLQANTSLDAFYFNERNVVSDRGEYRALYLAAAERGLQGGFHIGV